MSRVVNLYEAKTHLSRLVEDAAAGEEIVIAKSGRPLARLVPLQPVVEPRLPGLWKGQVWIAHDFDSELSESELSEWYGETDKSGS